MRITIHRIYRNLYKAPLTGYKAAFILGFTDNSRWQIVEPIQVTTWHLRQAGAELDTQRSRTGIYAEIETPGQSVDPEAIRLGIQIKQGPGVDADFCCDLRAADFRLLVAVLERVITEAEECGILPSGEGAEERPQAANDADCSVTVTEALPDGKAARGGTKVFTPEVFLERERTIECELGRGQDRIAITITEDDWEHRKIWLSIDVEGMPADFGGFIAPAKLDRMIECLTTARQKAAELGVLKRRQVPERRQV
jgi:hypothetical protein